MITKKNVLIKSYLVDIDKKQELRKQLSEPKAEHTQKTASGLRQHGIISVLRFIPIYIQLK